jgi:hypothetical protein
MARNASGYDAEGPAPISTRGGILISGTASMEKPLATPLGEG